MTTKDVSCRLDRCQQCDADEVSKKLKAGVVGEIGRFLKGTGAFAVQHLNKRLAGLGHGSIQFVVEGICVRIPWVPVTDGAGVFRHLVAGTAKEQLAKPDEVGVVDGYVGHG